MNIHHPATRILICGMTETGKSTLATRIIQNSRHDKIVVFDWQGGEYAIERLNENPLFTFRTLGQEWDTRRIFPFDPTQEFPDVLDGLDCLADFLLTVNDNCTDRILLVVDEGTLILNHGKMPDRFKFLWIAGRRWQIDIVWICHSYNDANLTIRNNLTEWYIFRQEDTKTVLPDLEALGFNPEKVSKLQCGQFLYRNKKTGEMSQHQLFKTGGQKLPCAGGQNLPIVPIVDQERQKAPIVPDATTPATPANYAVN
jgi:GTPase SAR1 family protein